MVNGSVTRVTGQMTERESIEAFSEGAKKAASAARELAKATNSPDWDLQAKMLDDMRKAGVQLAQMKSMLRLETLMAANIKASKFKPN